jgi:nitrogen fixation protein
MNLERINQIVEDYQKLEEHVKKTFSKLCELDSSTYSLDRGIEQIYIERNSIDITCDDSWGGSVDYAYYSFPIEWLTLDDIELEKVVEAKKIEREELKRKLEEEKQEREKLEREQREYQKYLSLKKKFENKV